MNFQVEENDNRVKKIAAKYVDGQVPRYMSPTQAYSKRSQIMTEKKHSL